MSENSVTLVKDRFVQPLTSEEEAELMLRTARENSDASELEKVEPPKKFEYPENTDLELMERLKNEPLSFYFDKKDLPDVVLKPYLPDLKRRWFELEARVKVIEKRLGDLNPPDRSLEEDRFEILVEVLDKACQGFEIFDEHEERNIPAGHRCVLESKLMYLIEDRFNTIEKILDEFDKLKNDQYGANNEREWLRYEIRATDLQLTEIHQFFLMSYLEQEWSF